MPGHEFDPDWEAQLDVDVIETDFGDPSKPFTLIPLKGEKPTGIPVVPEKQPEASGTPEKPKRKRRENQWDPKDEERLLKSWDEVKGTTMERAKLLAPLFQGRKPEAIYQKHWALTTDYTQKRRKTPQKPTEPSMRRVEKKPTVAKNVTCPKCGLPLDLCACVQVDREQERIKKLQKKIEDRPLSEDIFTNRKTKDIQPILEYQGRHILIKSDGTPQGTRIYIDGKVAENVLGFVLRGSAKTLITLEMEMYDF